MSTIKYILLVALLVLLWVTEPLWMVQSNTDTTASPMDIHIAEQQKVRGELLSAEAEELKNLEARFGKKPAGKYRTGVPLAVEEYWNKTLKYPNSLEEERCGPIRAGNNGWIAVCRYRAKTGSGTLELRQDTYTIKNGIVVK